MKCGFIFIVLFRYKGGVGYEFTHVGIVFQGF